MRSEARATDDSSRSAYEALHPHPAPVPLLCLSLSVVSMEWRKRKQFLLDKAKLRPAMEKEAADKAAAAHK